MQKECKILILGIGQSNFLNQLYGNIKLVNLNFTFEIDGYFDISKGKNKNEFSNIYTNEIDLKGIKVSKIDLYKSLFKILITRLLLWKILFFELKQGASYKKIKNLLISYSKTRHIVETYLIPLNYDIYHFHFCVPNNLIIVNFLPKRSNIIMSFWGSDLLRIKGVSNVFYVRNALKKASKITVQTPEMAEILLTKYGCEFRPKVQDIRFTLSETIFNNIDTYKTDYSILASFKEKYSIEKETFIVALGHNAFQENNHVKMIEVLTELPQTYKNRITFLIHLGYGGNEAYKNELMNIIETNEELNFVVIKDYFDKNEIAKLRVITDVLVQMPTTDALSGAMTEVLYAGNIVITGKWLPYGFLSRNGIKFKEISDFSMLPRALKDCIDNNMKNKQEIISNRQCIRALLFPERTTKDWINLFNELENKK